MKRVLQIAIMAAWVFCYTSFGETVIISPETRNGSFESGDITPWGGAAVVSNEYIAVHGVHYAQIGGIRGELFQHIVSPSPSMRFFVLSYCIRDGETAFPAIRGGLRARRSDGTYIYGDVIWSNTPPISSSAWVNHSYVLEFTEEWEPSFGMTVSVGFDHAGTYAVGFVDKVHLSQFAGVTGLSRLNIEDGSAALRIYHLTPPHTYRIERIADLQDGDWETLAIIDLTDIATEWSGNIDANTSRGFYRLSRE